MLVDIDEFTFMYVILQTDVALSKTLATLMSFNNSRFVFAFVHIYSSLNGEI